LEAQIYSIPGKELQTSVEPAVYLHESEAVLRANVYSPFFYNNNVPQFGREGEVMVAASLATHSTS
jgi:hypothetical protein